MALTQMALDSLDFDATVALAETVAPHVDILEIGTPCIKHNGIKLLETLRAKFPNNLILVDLKTMDAGEYEAEPFYKAGADICTVLGASGIATIKGVIAAAKKYGKEVQVDMINVDDKEALAKECVAACLTVDTNKRITIDGLLNHKWIASAVIKKKNQNPNNRPSNLSNTIHRLKKFNAKQKLKAVAFTVLMGKKI